MDLLKTFKSEYNSICRICLNQSEDITNINFTKFKFCTGIDISETPQSTQICSKCDSSLNELFIFKEKCIESHDSLIRMYSTITVESIDIDSNSFKIEPLEESNVDEYQMSDDVMENPVAEKEELVEVFMICEDNQISKDSSIDEMESNPSDSEYTKKKKIKTKETKLKSLPGNKKEYLICPHCGQKHSLTYMNTHIRNAHTTLSEQQRFECDICNKTYKNKESLKCHKRKHTDMVYACKICNKGFKNWVTRRSHMVFAHGEPYKYNCSICPFKTQGSSNYHRHLRSHTGEKPVKCPECPKTFSDNVYLKNHMVTHSNEKKFICEYCNKSFSLMKRLRTHIKIHTQERNYVCPVDSCGKSFIQNHVLKSHMKANHPEVEIPQAGTVVSIKPKKNLRME